jgi:hypothetical protein
VTADTHLVDTAGTKPRLGDLFVQRGLISQAQLEAALAEQRESGVKLGEILVEKGWVSRVDLASVISTQWDATGLTLSSVKKARPAPVPKEPDAGSPAVESALLDRLEQLAAELASRDERIERQSSTIDALLTRIAELEALLAGRHAA